MRRLFSMLFILIITASVVLVFSSPAAAQGNCPTPHLSVGGQGRVTPGSSNRIRDAASASGTKIGEIPAGGIFDVLEGPQCVDGFLWWRVSYEGIEGWTVEGNASGYFVEPFDASAPTETLAPVGEVLACPVGTAPEPRLVVGMQGRVSGNSPSRLRNAPSASGKQIGQIDPIDIFMVLDGPVCADGYNWWQVDVNGTQGWTAEGQDSDYFVEPIAATATPTATRTPLPTYTPTVTRTPGPTLTPTITLTPSITDTPFPTRFYYPRFLTWSADSKWLVVGNSAGVFLFDTGSLYFPLRALNIPQGINSILFSPTVPEQVAIADETHTYLYNVVTDQPIRDISASGHESNLVFSADGNKLALLDKSGHLAIYDVITGALIKYMPNLGGTVATLSPDGRYVAGFTEGGIARIALIDGSETWDLPVADKLYSIPNAIAFSPDSTKLVIGDQDGNIQLFDVTAPKKDRIAALIRAENDQSQSHFINMLAFSPDGSLIASAESVPQGILRIFKSNNLTQIDANGSIDIIMLALAFSPDGKYLVLSISEAVYVVDAHTYDQVAELFQSP